METIWGGTDRRNNQNQAPEPPALNTSITGPLA